MAKKTRPTFQKREREKAQQQKQKDKHARRAEAAEAKERRSSSPRDSGEDPDIAGIRPGPQPLPEQWGFEHDAVAESGRGATDDNL